MKWVSFLHDYATVHENTTTREQYDGRQSRSRRFDQETELGWFEEGKLLPSVRRHDTETATTTGRRSPPADTEKGRQDR